MNLGGTIRLNKFGVIITVFLFFILVLYVTSKNSDQSSKVNLKKLLIGSIETAIKGGKEVAEVMKTSQLNIRSKGKTKEGVSEPLTVADERSNCAMYYSLTHAFPKIQVVSEEVSKESECLILQTLDLDPNNLEAIELQDQFENAEDITVWIDPLDATVEYTEKLLQYVTTMVCVAVKGVPVIGVIHKPFGSDPKTYWAWVGKAVSKNLQVKEENPDKTLNVIVSRSHSGDVKEKAKFVFGDNVEIIAAGGSGYKSLEVASGNVSLYLHVTDIKKWDICAGNAIINAVNGKMTDLNNELIDYSDPKDKVTHGLISSLNVEYIDKIKQKFKV